jgi:hypothetical protein
LWLGVSVIASGPCFEKNDGRDDGRDDGGEDRTMVGKMGWWREGRVTEGTMCWKGFQVYGWSARRRISQYSRILIVVMRCMSPVCVLNAVLQLFLEACCFRAPPWTDMHRFMIGRGRAIAWQGSVAAVTAMEPI